MNKKRKIKAKAAQRTKTKARGAKRGPGRPREAAVNMSSHRTIRVPVGTYEKAQELIELASTKGWTAFGSTRTDRMTLGSIIDEALVVLKDSYSPAASSAPTPEVIPVKQPERDAEPKATHGFVPKIVNDTPTEPEEASPEETTYEDDHPAAHEDANSAHDDDHTVA